MVDGRVERLHLLVGALRLHAREDRSPLRAVRRKRPVEVPARHLGVDVSPRAFRRSARERHLQVQHSSLLQVEVVDRLWHIALAHALYHALGAWRLGKLPREVVVMVGPAMAVHSARDAAVLHRRNLGGLHWTVRPRRIEQKMRRSLLVRDAVDGNVLRARGQWKQGEDRAYYTDGSMAFLKADGGKEDNSTAAAASVKKNKNKDGEVLNNTQAYYASMTHTNTYYLSTGIAKTTAASDLQIKSYTQLPEEDEAVLSKIGATSDYDRMLNFIFNERTRELLGEWNRWDELARTGLLVKRAKAFNPEAAPNVQDRHMYRPIPQKFIDTLQNEDGSNLSDAEKKAWQNPGY